MLTSPTVGPLNKTLMLGLALVLLCFGAILVAVVLRFASPQSQITISAFQVLDTEEDAGGTSGKALSDLLVDNIQHILEQANQYSGNMYASKKTYRPIPDIPVIPVDTSYGIEIKGVSIDQIIATWKRVRDKEFSISGDFIPTTNGNSILVARYSTSGVAKSYRRTLKEVTPSEIRAAIFDLSLDLVKDINPQAAARYLISVATSCTTQCDAAWGAATQYCYSWTKNEPTNPSALYFMGYALANDHHPQEAIGYLDRAVGLNADQNSGFNRDSALNYKGLAFADLGQLDDADAAYNAALHIRKTPDPLLNLGVDALERGQYDRAEDLYRQALALDPGDEGALLNLGHVYLKDKKYPEAKVAYSQALEVQPGNTEAVYGLAHCLPKLGNVDGALSQVDLFTGLNKGSFDPSTMRVSALLLGDRLDDAETEFESTLGVTNTLAAQEYMAIISMYKGQMAVASAQFDKLLKNDTYSTDPWLHILKADVLDIQGDKTGAETERQKADDLSPGARYDFLHWNE